MVAVVLVASKEGQKLDKTASDQHKRVTEQAQLDQILITRKRIGRR